jgi:hypothetical protein
MRDPEDGYARDESEPERLDRNWNEILQELRVTQTGSQILAAFLLTLAFQPRFADLTAFQVTVYLVLVVLAAGTTALALAPVVLHRMLFRRGAKDRIVARANGVLLASLVGVGLVLVGTLVLIFDVVVGGAAGLVAGGAAFVIVPLLWLALPLSARPRTGAAR